MNEYLEKKHVPGMTLNIVNGDEVLVAGNYGLRDAEKKLPVTGKTLFRLGSISKMFQALTFLSIANLGDSEAQIKKFGFSFNLGTKVHDLISKLHPKGENYTEEKKIAEMLKTVTLYNLFTHTGGFEDKIPNLFLTRKTFKHFFGQNQKPEFTTDFQYTDDLGKIVSSFKWFPRKQITKPNEMISYSNVLTGVIGYLVELLEKKPLHMVAKNNIFDPLEMTKSELANDLDDEELSEGYAFMKKLINVGKLAVPIAGVGALQSNSDDIIKFMKFMNKAILPEAEQEFSNNAKLATLRKALIHMIDGEFINANLGNQPQLIVRDLVSGGPFLQALQDAYMYGLPNYGHAGGLAGFSSYMQFIPALNIGFMTSNNGGDNNAFFSEFVQMIMEEQPIDIKQKLEDNAKKSLAEQTPYSILQQKSKIQKGKITEYDLAPYVGTYQQLRASVSDYFTVMGKLAEFVVEIHNASEGILKLTCKPWSALRQVTGAEKVLLRYLGGDSFVEVLEGKQEKFISLSLTFFNSLDPAENKKLSQTGIPFKFAKTTYAMTFGRVDNFYDWSLFKIFELSFSLIGLVVILLGEIIYLVISWWKKWKGGKAFHYLILFFALCCVGHFVFVGSFFSGMEVIMDPQANKKNSEFNAFEKSYAAFGGKALIALTTIVHVTSIARHLTMKLTLRGKIFAIFLVSFTLVFAMTLVDLQMLTKESFGIF